jgi:hypothetical protein
MKYHNKLLIGIFASAIILISLAVTPCTIALSALPQKRDGKLLANIMDGFNHYITEKNVHLTSTNSAVEFSRFLKENPSFQPVVTEYLNLTKPDINKEVPLGHMSPPTVTSAPYKVVNVTLNGETHQLSYSNAIYDDGSSTIKIKVDCGGIDPEFCFHRVPEYIGPILMGEYDYIAVHFWPSEKSNFMNSFNDYIDDKTHYWDLASILMGILSFAIGAGVNTILGGVNFLGELTTVPEIENLDYFSDGINANYDDEMGLYYCFASDYTTLGPITLSVDHFDIYIKHFDENNNDIGWFKHYPHYTPSWFVENIGGDYADIIKQFMDEVFAEGYLDSTNGNEHWYSAEGTWPLPELPDYHNIPGWSSGFLFKPISTVDSANNSINSNVYISGRPCGNDNPTLVLRPTTQYVGVDQYIPTSGGYGYIFNDIVIEGNTYYDNIVAAELSTNSTITAHYSYGLLPTYTLTVNAFDLYLGEGWPYEVDVYLDNNYIGTTPLQTSVIVGDHTLSVDSSVYSQLWGIDAPFYDFTGDFDGYNLSFNPVVITIGMYSDSTVNARYWPW